MATVGKEQPKWEVVVKKKKDGKNSTKLSKSEKKALMDNMPKLLDIPPLKEEPTQFSTAFSEEGTGSDIRKPGGLPVAPPNVGNNAKLGKASRKKQAQAQAPQGKKKSGKSIDSSDSLDKALQEISAEQIGEVINVVQQKFPDNPTLWLKDVASFLNSKLASLSQQNELITHYNTDMPSSGLLPKVRKQIQKLVKQCKLDVLEVIYEYCLNVMIDEINRNAPCIGYQVFLQCLVFEKPDIMLKYLDKYSQKLQQWQNRPMNCHTILWVLAQSGYNNKVLALKVWLHAMLPMLGVKLLAPSIMTYLEEILSDPSVVDSMSKQCGVIGESQFFHIFDHVHASQPAVNKEVHRRLCNLYPKIKVISFAHQPESKMRYYLPMFLARLAPSDSEDQNDDVRTEILSCLDDCLVFDKHCYSAWIKIYTRHVSHSAAYLEHISATLGALKRRKVDIKLLMETVRTFSVTNEDLLHEKKMPPQATSYSMHCCKKLLHQLEQYNRSNTFKLLTLFILAAMVALYWDINRNGGFHKCTTKVMLERSGLMVILQHFWTRISAYSKQAYALLGAYVNMTVIEEKVGICVAFISYYLHIVWQNGAHAAHTVYTYAAHAAHTTNTYIDTNHPQVKVKLYELYEGAVHVIETVWPVVVTYVTHVLNLLAYYIRTSIDYIQYNILRSDAALSTYKWINETAQHLHTLLLQRIKS